MTELEDIILTIDTREQNKIRIKAVEDYFLQHGATVEHILLKHCDYRLIGECRGQSVNLGVEAKGWNNFLSDDIAEMEEKLLLATEEYDYVGFFVETQNYTFTPDENNKHGKLNYSIPRLNKDLPSKTLAAFEGLLHTISKHPQIYVTQLRGEAQFPYSLYDLLVYIQKPHTLTVKPEGYVPSLQNVYMQIPQIGIERAKKLIQHYPNLFWLCSASEPSLVEVMGQSVGTILYQFLHNNELATPEWKSGHHLDGTEKLKTICGQDCYNPQHCNTLCERHPNNPKMLKDNEGRLAFDAPAKNPVNSESVAIMAAIEGYLSGFKEGRTANEICDHFNILSGDSDKEQMLKYIKRLAWEGRITSDGQLFKIISSHVPDSIPLGGSGTDTLQSLSTENPDGNAKGTKQGYDGTHDTHSSHAIDAIDSSPYSIADTIPSHTEAAILSNTTTTPSASGDTKQGIPPIANNLSPADTDLSYLDEKTEYREVKPNKLDLKKPKMNLKETIKDFMADCKPHLLQDIVDHCEEWTPGNVFEHVMGAVKSGYFKKVTEQDGRVITFQRMK